MNNKPVTAIIVGAGHRAFVYSELAKTNPDLLKIVGVADPNPVRRKKAMDYFGFSEDMCFETAQELAEKICESAKRRRTDTHEDDITVLTAILNKSV